MRRVVGRELEHPGDGPVLVAARRGVRHAALGGLGRHDGDLVDAERATDHEVLVVVDQRVGRGPGAGGVEAIVLDVEDDLAAVDAAVVVDELGVGLEALDRILGEVEGHAAEGDGGVHADLDLARTDPGAVATGGRRLRRAGLRCARASGLASRRRRAGRVPPGVFPPDGFPSGVVVPGLPSAPGTAAGSKPGAFGSVIGASGSMLPSSARSGAPGSDGSKAPPPPRSSRNPVSPSDVSSTLSPSETTRAPTMPTSKSHTAATPIENAASAPGRPRNWRT